MRKIQEGDTVRKRGELILWHVSQVHTTDHSADIWRRVEAVRVEENVSLAALERVTE